VAAWRGDEAHGCADVGPTLPEASVLTIHAHVYTNGSMDWEKLAFLPEARLTDGVTLQFVYEGTVTSSRARDLAAETLAASGAQWFVPGRRHWRLDLTSLRQAFELGDGYEWMHGQWIDVEPTVELSADRDGRAQRRLTVVVAADDVGPIASMPADRERAFDARALDERIVLVARQRYLDGRNLDAVHRASEALIREVRNRSGLDADGRDLMARAFGSRGPLRAAGDDGEVEAMMFLFMGAVGAVRNPAAHVAGTEDDEVDDADALDRLSFLNLLFRHLRQGGLPRSPPDREPPRPG